VPNDEPVRRSVEPALAVAEMTGRIEAVMDEPVNLSERRRKAAQKATDLRRRQLYGGRADPATSRSRQHQLETHLAAPAETWPEVADKARFLIQLYAGTSDAREPRHQELIEQTLDELTRLCDRTPAPS
jgi:hypothetical protein